MRERDVSMPEPKRGRSLSWLSLGAVAVTMAALCAGLVASEGPAYADVTSGDYTIGAPSGAVTGLVASPTSVGAGTTTSFTIKFKAGAALSGSGDDWVTVAPSKDLTSVPSSIDLVSGSCIQSGTAGAGGAGTASATGLTIELAASCSIGAGAMVEVDFDAGAPAATGTFDFTATTSKNGTQATSNSVAVGSSGPVLSAASYEFGDNATYTISNVTVTDLSSGSGTLVLKAVIDSGTAAIVFYDGASGYHVTYTPPVGSASADDVEAAAVSGPTVTLTLASSVVDGGTLSITALGTNPAAGATTETNSIAVQPGNGTPETTNAITFGNSVTGVTVSPSSSIAGAAVTYTVGFRATDAVGVGGDVFLSETAGPTNFSSVTGILVSDTTQHWQFVATGAVLTDGTVKIPLSDAIEAGDSVTVLLANVTNPATAGTIGDFSVSTSLDQVAAVGAPYTIGPNASPGLVVSVNPATAGSLAVYTISDLRASAAITGGSSTLTIEAPTGTVFPNNASDYTITDSTTASGSGAVSKLVSGGGTNSAVITVPNSIALGDVLTITVQDAINPGTASGTYTITLAGSVTGPPAAAPTTTTTTKPPKKTPPRPTVTALTTKVTVKGGKVELSLRCRIAACQGKVTLVDVKTVLGTKTYDLKTGKTGSVVVKLSKPALKIVDAAKNHTIKAKETVTVKAGKTVTKKITVVG